MSVRDTRGNFCGKFDDLSEILWKRWLVHIAQLCWNLVGLLWCIMGLVVNVENDGHNVYNRRQYSATLQLHCLAVASFSSRHYCYQCRHIIVMCRLCPTPSLLCVGLHSGHEVLKWSLWVKELMSISDTYSGHCCLHWYLVTEIYIAVCWLQNTDFGRPVCFSLIITAEKTTTSLTQRISWWSSTVAFRMITYHFFRKVTLVVLKPFF